MLGGCYYLSKDTKESNGKEVQEVLQHRYKQSTAGAAEAGAEEAGRGCNVRGGPRCSFPPRLAKGWTQRICRGLAGAGAGAAAWT